jgi:hypothetical protein
MFRYSVTEKHSKKKKRKKKPFARVVVDMMEDDGHVYDETSRTLRCNLFKGKSATRLLRSLQEHAGTLEHLQVQLVTNLTIVRTVALTPLCSPLADNWTMRRTWPLCLKSCPAASRS